MHTLKVLFFLSLSFQAFSADTEPEITTKDFKNETISTNTAAADASGALTAEQSAELQANIALIKKNEEAAQKLLQELDSQ